MGIYNKLADDIDEVDVIIAGGKSFARHFPSRPNRVLIIRTRWHSRLHHRRPPR
jgi:hypothetical protein